MLGLEAWRARTYELLAETILYITGRYGVMKRERECLIEAQTRAEDGIVTVDVARAPIIGKSAVEAFGAFGIDTPECLAGHPIDQVVSRLPFSGDCRELRGIVGSAELVESGVALARFDVVERAHGSCLFARSEANFRHTYGRTAELWDEPG